jgi:hypothetical protein
MSLLLMLQVRYTMVQLDYLVHKDYIVSELCVEKDVPESTCEGKCHLRKELSKLDEQHDSQSNAPIQVTLSSIDFVVEAVGSSMDLNAAILSIYELERYLRVLTEGTCQIESPPPELAVHA